MHQSSPQQFPSPSTSLRQPVKRQFPFRLVGLIVIVLLVSSIYGCGSSQNTGGNTPQSNAGTPSTVVQRPTPHVGGTYGDFLAKYGPPVITDGGNPGFYADSSKTISLLPLGLRSDGYCLGILSAQSDKVCGMSIYGPDTWTPDHTKNYCQQFLPVGSVIYHPPNATIVADNVTLYQSSFGIIDLQINGNNGCDLGPYQT